MDRSELGYHSKISSPETVIRLTIFCSIVSKALFTWRYLNVLLNV